MSFTGHLTSRPWRDENAADIEMSLSAEPAENVWQESVCLTLKARANMVFIHFTNEQWAQFKTLVGNSLENDEKRVEYTFKGGTK